MTSLTHMANYSCRFFFIRPKA